MRTTLDIPEQLIQEAMQVAGVKIKTQAIVLALQEMIQKYRGRKVLKLKGTMEVAYDYKSLRRKR